MIEDAAEALGSTYRGHQAGTFGRLGAVSFNGNKIMTAGSGGMVVTGDPALADRVRHLATQAREPVRHYEHRSIGYNYRMNNLLAAIARAQLARLPDLVAARRSVFARYAERLKNAPGVTLMPEADHGVSNRWLTVVRIDADAFGATPTQVCDHLETCGIEARPAWKPMHQQPVFAGAAVIGGAVADRIYAEGVCLPSGSALSEIDQDLVIEALMGAPVAARGAAG
jgi:dTDP-4-amino-4,6-dideoxygalactose transaminase